MSDDRDAVPLDEVLASLPAERQARIRARGAELIAEELALRDGRLVDLLNEPPVERTSA
jgi:hypothetical protein